MRLCKTRVSRRPSSASPPFFFFFSLHESTLDPSFRARDANAPLADYANARRAFASPRITSRSIKRLITTSRVLFSFQNREILWDFPSSRSVYPLIILKRGSFIREINAKSLEHKLRISDVLTFFLITIAKLKFRSNFMIKRWLLESLVIWIMVIVIITWKR